MSTSRMGSAERARTGTDGSTVRAMLRVGSLAGPVYVVLGFGQAAVRDGFDITRHAFSLMANGPFGWVQEINFLLTGALVIVAAQGLRRGLVAAGPGRGPAWAGWLLTGYGLSLMIAGVFTADPALGFPPGTPADQMAISWHGMVHFVAGGLGFACFIAACLILARRFQRQGSPGWSIFSLATGVIFLFAFAGIASGSRGPTTLAFVGAVVLSFGWLLAVTRRTARAV